jgi:hypothetical protein
MAEKNDILQLDPFDKPIAGQGMTAPPQGRIWEMPPKTADPDEAVTTIIDKIESNDTAKTSMLNLMTAGTPIESITNTITWYGFADGQWTPDIAELIKLPVASYLIGLAMENNIEATVYNQSPADVNKEPTDDLNKMMISNRPEMFDQMVNNMKVAQKDNATAEDMENQAEFDRMNQDVNQLPEDLGGFMPRREVV